MQEELAQVQWVSLHMHGASFPLHPLPPCLSKPYPTESFLFGLILKVYHFFSVVRAFYFSLLFVKHTMRWKFQARRFYFAQEMLKNLLGFLVVPPLTSQFPRSNLAFWQLELLNNEKSWEKNASTWKVQPTNHWTHWHQECVQFIHPKDIELMAT